jgi:hypothetical protein
VRLVLVQLRAPCQARQRQPALRSLGHDPQPFPLLHLIVQLVASIVPINYREFKRRKGLTDMKDERKNTANAERLAQRSKRQRKRECMQTTQRAARTKSRSIYDACAL